MTIHELKIATELELLFPLWTIHECIRIARARVEA